MSKTAMKLALEALEDLIPLCDPGFSVCYDVNKAIAALRAALANEALDKMAENARELGLDYEVEPKIGCVNHDCDKCKAQQEPAQQEYTSFAEWANDYVRANLHKLKPAQQEPVAFEEWLAKQHGDPEEIGFLQALRISYIAGQDSITSPPAKRTLVGLTESEITTSLPYSVTRDKGCFHAGALWAEAKLKEKNT